MMNLMEKLVDNPDGLITQKGWTLVDKGKAGNAKKKTTQTQQSIR